MKKPRQTYHILEVTRATSHFRALATLGVLNGGPGADCGESSEGLQVLEQLLLNVPKICKSWS